MTREESLDPIESRGYDVTNVHGTYDGRRITLMVQGIAQKSVRCDQVVLPWQVDEGGPAHGSSGGERWDPHG